jgi:hypothetical protein
MVSSFLNIPKMAPRYQPLRDELAIIKEKEAQAVTAQASGFPN